MITFSLQSGSNGNSIYVEAGGVRLLFDAGISGKMAQQRMARHGRDIHHVDALLISHDHSDHVRCAGIYHRKFALPVYITRVTYRAVGRHLGPIDDLRHFKAGQTLEFGPVKVHSVRTPHDAADGVVFIVEHEGSKLGILTDLGHPFAGLDRLLADVDAAYLESNYDPDLLETGPYPAYLKARVRGVGGHLSNHESAKLVAACHGRTGPQWIALAHLSEENNCPDLALQTHRACVGTEYPYHLASRDGVSEVLAV